MELGDATGLYENAVFDNSYIKFREATFSYNLPAGLTSRLHFRSLQLACDREGTSSISIRPCPTTWTRK